MWLALAKYGVPNVIKSLHDNMQAGITLDGNLANIEVSNGLRQGVCSCSYFVHFIL